ncbi:microcephalin isoform X2 [Coregonus clupeaformis]|uniref:microcephalin isoform X2 n=1 Tax=Coregonus clupeaformis TaxID=59861 RepID=UPI001BDFC47E|nr:microcephalin isoform X2 [Coregonus clupeaformis]
MTSNSRPNCAAILKDVVAYVDVWSSSKTENYSKPFIQQLQDMGAEVSKTFNKQVTHVVFKNGHHATWNKAKKTGVRLVSVLWVARCKDDGEHVNEELCPALNDEVNPALKKRHRCMQPRDTPERTPENDRRMKKKLDKIIKDLVPKSPLITDVSPYIIDEENGIVFSPSMKRSDSMAQRLKEMREKRENLSPTASQIQSRLSPELKTSLGNIPSRSFLQQLYEEPDDDFNASVGSNKTDGEKQHEATSETQHKKDFQKPWMSPCSVVPRQKTSNLPNSPAKEKASKQDKNPKRTSIKSDGIKKHISLDSPCRDDLPKGSKSVQSVFTFDSFVVGKNRRSTSRSNMAKVIPPVRKSRTPQSLPESKPTANLEISSSTILPEKLNMPHQTSVKITKLKSNVSQRRKSLLPALARSCTVSNDSHASSCAYDDENDGVFEDFFSPANNPRRQQSLLLPSLSSLSKVLVPFELEPPPSPGKRKRGRSETTRSELVSAKKRKNEVPIVKETSSESSSVSSVLDQHEHPHQDTKGLASSEDNNTKQTVTKRSTQSTLSFSRVPKDSTDELTSAPEKWSASTDPTHLSKPNLTAANKALDKQNSSYLLPRHKDNRGKSSPRLEIVGRGTAYAAAAGVTDTISDNLSKQKRQVNVVDKSMDKNTKTLRTLVMTSMPTEKQHTVTQVVRALGGFSVVDQVCESTTHVVSGSHRRTLNILLGISRGCWILSFEWILWCLEQRQWIPEEPYELSDQFPAAPICRLQQHLSAGEHQQDLFLNQPAMFVSRNTQPPTHSLVELIQLCGGTVCKTVRQTGLCIGEYNGKRPEGSRILSEQWVLGTYGIQLTEVLNRRTTHNKKMPPSFPQIGLYHTSQATSI